MEKILFKKIDAEKNLMPTAFHYVVNKYPSKSS